MFLVLCSFIHHIYICISYHILRLRFSPNTLDALTATDILQSTNMLKLFEDVMLLPSSSHCDPEQSTSTTRYYISFTTIIEKDEETKRGKTFVVVDHHKKKRLEQEGQNNITHRIIYRSIYIIKSKVGKGCVFLLPPPKKQQQQIVESNVRQPNHKITI